MSKSLRKEICNPRLPGIHTSEVDRSKVKQYIPAGLGYACSYWVHHFQESDLSPPLLETVYKFLKQYLLHWFEALGLLGKMQESIYMLSTLRILVQVNIPFMMRVLANISSDFSPQSTVRLGP